MEACKLSYYDSSETEAVVMQCLVTQPCAVLFLSYQCKVLGCEKNKGGFEGTGQSKPGKSGQLSIIFMCKLPHLRCLWTVLYQDIN